MRIGWALAAMVAAFLAGLAGVGAGRWLMPSAPSAGSELHAVLHHELDLDAGQKTRLDTLEQRFGARRASLEAEMRADNRRLAAAIAAEHGYGPGVAAAVGASHLAMGELQKATLAHVFAMRALLRPDQTARFDRAVRQSLTSDRR